MRCIKLFCWMTFLLTLSSCSSKKLTAELIGFWESTDAKKESSVEFGKDGFLVFSGMSKELLDAKVMKIIRDFNMTLPVNAFKFKVTDKDHIEVEGNFAKLLEGLSAGSKEGSKPSDSGIDFFPKETLTFVIAGKELTLTGANGKSIKFVRGE